MYLVGLRWSLFGLIASGSDIFFFFQKFRVKGLFGLSNFGLSWLISSHIILFILPAEHYLLDQPNSPESSIWRMRDVYRTKLPAVLYRSHFFYPNYGGLGSA